MLNWLANFSTEHQKKKSVAEPNENINSNNNNNKKQSITENDEWRKKRNSILQVPEVGGMKPPSMILERVISPIVKF